MSAKDLLDKILGIVKDNPGATGAGLGALAAAFGLGGSNNQAVGYQGGIPLYEATRKQVPYDYAAEGGYGGPDAETRRPGSFGRRYFSDTMMTEANSEDTAAAESLADSQVASILNNGSFNEPNPFGPGSYQQNAPTAASINQGNSDRIMEMLEEILNTGSEEASSSGPTAAPTPTPTPTPSNSDGLTFGHQSTPTPAPAPASEPETASRISNLLGTVQNQRGQQPPSSGGLTFGFAQGGLAALKDAKGFYLGGPTDGMADKVPATIEGREPAALSDGEFVVPADVVSHLGNGNSSAGAKQLQEMMENIRKARTGNPQQGKQINPKQFIPR